MTALGGLAQLLQLVHLVPPLVGLVLVLASGARGPWRIWAFAFFGLSILGTLGNTGWLLVLMAGGTPRVGGGYAVYGVVSAGFGLLSLVGASCAVAAILSGRGVARGANG